jgi:hypothetical protein
MLPQKSVVVIQLLSAMFMDFGMSASVPSTALASAFVTAELLECEIGSY